MTLRRHASALVFFAIMIAGGGLLLTGVMEEGPNNRNGAWAHLIFLASVLAFPFFIRVDRFVRRPA